MINLFNRSKSDNHSASEERPYEWTKLQPKTTYFGYEIDPIRVGLPKQIESLCPDCKRIIPAVLYEEDGSVLMKKTCPEHGVIQDVFFSDVDLYYKAERLWYGDQRGLENPKVKSATICPEHCGLCNMHTSVSSLPIIDLTNRCNLTCPVCFANANAAGYLYEPTYEEVIGMLETLLTQKPVACDRVQFSGGEPTVHPDFLKIVATAHEMGFDYVQVNTNGIKTADLEFAQACKEAGVESFYLQFDGIDDAIFKKTRGEPLLEYKFKTIENCRKVGLSVILVDTVINGLNNHHVGRVLQLAIDNYDVVKGVAYQPVSLTGRIAKRQRMKMRYTLGDLAHDLEEQFEGELNAKEDWFPMACSVPLGRLVGAIKGKPSLTVSCHPHCSMGTYIFLEKGTGRLVPVSHFIDMEGLLAEVNDIAAKITPNSKFGLLSQAKAFLRLKKYFKPEGAPNGLTFEGFLQTLDGYENKTQRRVNLGKVGGYPSVFAAGMHFMDNYNYSIERVRRCIIHYVTPNGFVYPFCTYNTGMVFRERTESRYRLAAEQVIEKMKKEDFPKELRQLAKKMKLNVQEIRTEADSQSPSCTQ